MIGASTPPPDDIGGSTIEIPRDDFEAQARAAVERPPPQEVLRAREAAERERQADADVARVGSLARVPVLKVDRHELGRAPIAEHVAIVADAIDGVSSLAMILEVVPLERAEALRAICVLLDEHVVEIV